MKLRVGKTNVFILIYCTSIFSSIAVASDAINAEKDNENPSANNSISYGWDATLASKYIWQGFDYSNGGMVLQPEAYLTINDFTATVWINHDIVTNKSDEFDLYLQYDWSFPSHALSAGYAYYEYPQNEPHRDNWDASQEIYLDISIESTLTPSLSMHYDFDAGDGVYYALGVSHEYQVAAQSFSLAANLFYHDNYFESSGIPSFELNASTVLNTGSLTISPSVSYFHTWENGDFRGVNSAPEVWLFSVNIAKDY